LDEIGNVIELGVINRDIDSFDIDVQPPDNTLATARVSAREFSGRDRKNSRACANIKERIAGLVIFIDRLRDKAVSSRACPVPKAMFGSIRMTILSGSSTASHGGAITNPLTVVGFQCFFHSASQSAFSISVRSTERIAFSSSP
jgi:hypothetical protein